MGNKEMTVANLSYCFRIRLSVWRMSDKESFPSVNYHRRANGKIGRNVHISDSRSEIKELDITIIFISSYCRFCL